MLDLDTLKKELLELLNALHQTQHFAQGNAFFVPSFGFVQQCADCGCLIRGSSDMEDRLCKRCKEKAQEVDRLSVVGEVVSIGLSPDCAAMVCQESERSGHSKREILEAAVTMYLLGR